ncbi:MAG: magnesium transporter [Chloroflexi bacterium]|nr:magnesium transporter [Chloroflexota bacterium]
MESQPSTPQVIEEQITQAVEQENYEQAAALLSTLHPADQAELLQELDLQAQEQVLAQLSAPDAAYLVEQLEPEAASQLAGELEPEHLADILDAAEPDIAADVLNDLEPEQAASTLEEMEKRDEVTPLLAYPDESAGGLMNPHFVPLRADMTVENALQFLRQLAPDAEVAYYLYVLDDAQHLVGVVGLRELIISDPRRKIGEIMNSNVLSVPAGTDQEEVANLLSKYDLLSLPVVDADRHVLGIITVDDVVDVMEREATEDILRLAMIADEERVFGPFAASVKRRLPWLYVNLATAFLAAWVVSLFEGTIQRAAVLAVFQSIVAGQGGNAGTQTLTVIVRGLALGEIELRDAWRALLREFALGVINGLAIGIAVGLIAYIWKGNIFIGLVLGLAMVGNMVAAALSGVIVPLGLKIFRVDPALASAVFVTTVTDVCGFFFFLGLATIFLNYLGT